jgi:isoleucyl-tRNA synthetase
MGFWHRQSVIIAFPTVDDPNVMFLAWTTTPWTLPSNVALCVHPTLVYARVRDLKTGRVYIVVESRLDQVCVRVCACACGRVCVCAVRVP